MLSFAVNRPRRPFALSVAAELEAGITGICGPSGAGKTTLLETLAGLRGGTDRLLLQGRSLVGAGDRLRPEQREAGYVPQDGRLFPHLTVRQHLAFGPPRRRSDEHLTNRVVELLQLTVLLDRYPGRLSGGERQRVALARALCSRPAWLLADEALGALEASLRGRLWRELRSLLVELELPVLWVSHDCSELQLLCDHLLVLSDGRLLGQGEPLPTLARYAGFALSEGPDRGFHATWPGVLAQDAAGGIAVDVGGLAVQVAGGPAGVGVGAPVHLTIPADAVLVARGDPGVTSARNVWSAEVEALDEDAAGTTAWLRCGAKVPRLAARLTAAAVAELDLTPGCRVYVLVKSSACRVLAA
ncbi:MAG: ATP-binding cassette domain-containing protein [Pseudomonadota bacterium]